MRIYHFQRLFFLDCRESNDARAQVDVPGPLKSQLFAGGLRQCDHVRGYFRQEFYSRNCAVFVMCVYIWVHIYCRGRDRSAAIHDGLSGQWRVRWWIYIYIYIWGSIEIIHMAMYECDLFFFYALMMLFNVFRFFFVIADGAVN